MKKNSIFVGLLLLGIYSCNDDKDHHYVQKPFYIEATSGPHGIIVPSGVRQVISRHPQFSFYPDEGYKRDSLIINGTVISDDTIKFATYVVDTKKEFIFFSLDTTNSTIRVTFKKE